MLWADFSRFSAFCFPLSAFARWWLWWSLGVALWSHWGSFGVAIGCLSTGFDVALMWLWAALRSPLSGFRFQHFSFCLSVALGGFAPPFDVGSWMFDAGCSVLTISVPNTTSLSRLPRGGLGAPWTYPGTIDHPQSPIFKQVSLSNSKFESGLLPGTGLLRPGLPRNRAASRALPGRSAAAARLQSW
jgi:hypothetical protein